MAYSLNKGYNCEVNKAEDIMKSQYTLSHVSFECSNLERVLSSQTFLGPTPISRTGVPQPSVLFGAAGAENGCIQISQTSMRRATYARSLLLLRQPWNQADQMSKIRIPL